MYPRNYKSVRMETAVCTLNSDVKSGKINSRSVQKLSQKFTEVQNGFE